MGGTTDEPGRGKERKVRRLGPLVLRTLSPDDPSGDLELVVAVVGLLGIVGAILLPLDALARVLPPCTFHRLTGRPCLTCGTTRVLLALARGRIAAALAWNPLVAGFTIAFLAWTPVAAAQWLFRLPRWRIGFAGARARWTAVLLVVVMLALDWAYLVWRGV